MKEFISRLTWVEFIAFFAVLRGIYVGYKSGLFPEFLRIAAYLLTVIVTFRFQEDVTQFLTINTFLNETSAKAVAFLALLLGLFALSKLVTLLVMKLLKVGEGGFMNRLFGAVVGALRWIILLSLVFMLIEVSPFTPLKTDIRTRSMIGQPISRVAPQLFDFLSKFSPQLGTPSTTEKAAA